MSKVIRIEVGPWRQEAWTNIRVDALQVKFPDSQDYVNFTDEIEGFTHVDSHAYVLDVQVTMLPKEQIMMDASDRTYKLVKIISDDFIQKAELKTDGSRHIYEKPVLREQ
jgi:hypothetical protein